MVRRGSAAMGTCRLRVQEPSHIEPEAEMRLRIAVFAVVTLLAVVASTLISVLRMEGPASAEQMPNGLQAASAAPSCLAIKQNFPSSESGT